MTRATLVCSIGLALAAGATSCASNAAKPRFRPLRIRANGDLVPAPDGSLLAGIDNDRYSVTLYDASGGVHGRYRARTFPQIRWLHDSSALLVWTHRNQPSPVLLVNRQGKARATGLDDGAEAALSPNGRWLADTLLGRQGEQGVQLARRSGGPPTTVIHGRGVRLLGWQRSRIVYLDHAAIYSASPHGRDRRRLTALPAGVRVQAPYSGPDTSPDGLVTIISSSPPLRDYELVGDRLRPLPNDTVEARHEPVFWRGSHQILGQSRTGKLEIIDLLHDRIARKTGLSARWVQAVSGQRVASVNGDSDTVRLLNLQTHQTIDLGKEPTVGLIGSIGNGRFILHGSGRTYLLPGS